MQKACLAEDISTGEPHLTLRFTGVLRGYAKGNRHDGFKLENISDIIHKGLRLAGMDETDRWSISRSQDGSLADAVETGSRGPVNSFV